MLLHRKMTEILVLKQNYFLKYTYLGDTQDALHTPKYATV